MSSIWKKERKKKKWAGRGKMESTGCVSYYLSTHFRSCLLGRTTTRLLWCEPGFTEKLLHTPFFFLPFFLSFSLPRVRAARLCGLLHPTHSRYPIHSLGQLDIRPVFSVPFSKFSLAGVVVVVAVAPVLHQSTQTRCTRRLSFIIYCVIGSVAVWGTRVLKVRAKLCYSSWWCGLLVLSFRYSDVY